MSVGLVGNVLSIRVLRSPNIDMKVEHALRKEFQKLTEEEHKNEDLERLVEDDGRIYLGDVRGIFACAG